MSIGALKPGGGFFSPTIPDREPSVLPGKDETVFAGEDEVDEVAAFLGGRPSLEGPGPTDWRNDGLGEAAT